MAREIDDLPTLGHRLGGAPHGDGPGPGVRGFEPEHSRTECDVEWWFFQGYYDGQQSGRRHFMVTLFRSTLHVLDGGEASGFQLMVTVLDPRDPAGHQPATWVDPALVRWAVEKMRTAEPHVDAAIWRAYANLIEHEGPPHPIETKPPVTVFEPSPLRVAWGDFALNQTAEDVALVFHEPGSHRTVSLRLEAAAPRLDVRCGSDVVPLGEGMTYHAYPRVRIGGTIGGAEAVSGECWMDHQWGDTDWFRDAQAGIMLGWDWFGINLEDGTDLLVMRHRDAKSGRPVGMHATERDLAGRTRTVHNFMLVPLRRWTSPDTFIEYPVAWKIEIPDFDAELVFEPLCDDQELASFGTMRAVWEGAGRVEGRIGSRSVCGRARGEFHGYGYVFDHQDFVNQMCRRVDRHLEGLLPRRFDANQVEQLVGPPHWQHDIDAYTEMLSVPVWDLMDRRGRRWRPMFGILLLECLGVRSAPYEGLISCMLEFIHAGALIIDDIEDDSQLRRGEECLHLRYGVDVAINAGNTLYFLPSNAVMRHPLLTPEQRSRWLDIKERICIEAHCGQATDIFWSKRMSLERLRRMLATDGESRILQMYAFKTASAAKGAAEFVCALADADSQLTSACVDFARMLGVSYQIVDDIHNFSRSPDWTKVTGEDLANGKLTFVIATALRMLPGAEANRLQEILCDREARRLPPILHEGVELVHRSGALDTCRDLSRDMVDRAWDAFSGRIRPSGPKVMLHTMCLKLIDLAYDG